MFELYFQLGLEHIADLAGYDHILFILALCGVYLLKDWRTLLVLITAFTIGHSITLALAVLDVVKISSEWIEFLIPVTIFLTASYNIITGDKQSLKSMKLVKYLAALFFGLIHGLGFSNYLGSLLGKEADLLMPLFAFNIGLEAGQIFIVMIILLLSFFIVNILRVKNRDKNLVLSGAAGGISLIMLLERFPG